MINLYIIVNKGAKTAPGFVLSSGETIIPVFFEKQDAMNWSAKQSTHILDMSQYDIVLADEFMPIDAKAKRVLMVCWGEEWKYLIPEWKEFNPFSMFQNDPFGLNSNSSRK